MAGIFQFESSGMQSYMTRLQPTQIGDIIAMSALYRPGALNARVDENAMPLTFLLTESMGGRSLTICTRCLKPF